MEKHLFAATARRDFTNRAKVNTIIFKEQTQKRNQDLSRESKAPFGCFLETNRNEQPPEREQNYLRYLRAQKSKK